MAHFTPSKNMALLEAIIEYLGTSSITKARKLIKHGLVKINDKPALRADEKVQKGDQIQVADKREVQRLRAPFEILFEDPYLLIAVKPAGILSVDRENERNERTFLKIVNRYVKDSSGGKERAFLVHRLDREVSGIMIFAKSIEIEHLLEERWPDNEKLYWAIVEGAPPKLEGSVESWLAENRALKVYSTSAGPHAKLAITHYRVAKKIDATHALVEIRLETGRKNQIRVHLSDLGCPIIGDKKYGARSDPIRRIALHAFRFGFNHPVSGERIAVESSLPPEMKRLV